MGQQWDRFHGKLSRQQTKTTHKGTDLLGGEKMESDIFFLKFPENHLAGDFQYVIEHMIWLWRNRVCYEKGQDIRAWSAG